MSQTSRHSVNRSRNNCAQQARCQRRLHRDVSFCKAQHHLSARILFNLCWRRRFKTCQGEISGNTTDIYASCKVTESCFQMKPSALKRRDYLDTENSGANTKLCSRWKHQLCGSFHGSFWVVYEGPRITQQMFQRLTTTSVHPVLNHSSLPWRHTRSVGQEYVWCQPCTWAFS